MSEQEGGQPPYWRQPYGQPGYAGSGGYEQPGYPAYSYPVSPPNEQTAIAALVLACASFVLSCLGIVTAIIALVLAGSASRKIAASGGRLGGASLVKAARIVSWVFIGLYVLIVFGFVGLVAAGAMSEPAATVGTPI